MDGTLLYLSAADVESAAVELDTLRERVAAAFAAKARGAARVEPKVALTLAPGHFFQAMPGALIEGGLAGVKWIGVVPAAQTSGPTIDGLIILSDLASGRPLVIMDANWITAARTAAMSAIAAASLARPEATTIGFVGGGVQARSHLAALRRVLPHLARVVAYSRTASSAEAFAAEARAVGLAATTTREPRDAVAGMDVVVTSVPAGPGLRPFLDPSWLAPGAFVSAVDLGRSWPGDALRRLELLATDDRAQSEALARAGKFASGGPFDADLAEITTRGRALRETAEQRSMFLFAGHALGDLAAAQAVYDAARARGLGTKLPR
jgi:alanine dehydrogenase